MSRLTVPAALFALPPFVLVSAFGGPRWALAPVAACLVVLVYAAVRIWSPLVVLGLAVVAGASVFVWWFAIVAGSTCGASRTATIVEWVGTAVLAIAVPAWQLPRGRAIFWAIPAAAVLAAIWFIAAAHVIPNGSGGCFQ